MKWTRVKWLCQDISMLIARGNMKGCMKPFLIWSRTVWQSISTCFVCSWNTGLLAICVADLLSQNSLAEVHTMTFKSLRSWWSHKSSHVTRAMLRYYASVLFLLTVFCFLDFQLIREVPRYTQKPDIERLESRHVTQSASANAFKQISESSA